MENEQPQQDTTPAQPVEQTPGQQDRPEPATPAHEEADRASGQDQEADEPVVETDAEEPNLTNADPGDDNEVQPPAEASEESYQADPEDRDGAQDHPEA